MNQLRKKTARTIRRAVSADRPHYIASPAHLPVWLERLLLVIADRLHPRTALTCRHCGTRIDYRGSIHDQADRAYQHSETHYQEPTP